MKKNNLFEPQRQSIFAIVLILLKFAKILVKQLWPALLIILVGRKGDLQLTILIVLGVTALVSLIGSVIAYYKFIFYIKDDQLHIQKGLFRRTTLNIPFDRIQTIDFEQNVIHQVFNVVRVNIDSAGTKGSEISFDALEVDHANALRDYILAHKLEAGESTREVLDGTEDQEVILHLTPRDLVKIGISQNHLRTAALIIAVAYPLLDNLGQIFHKDLIEQAQDEIGILVQSSIILVLIAIPVFLFISFLITLVRTVVRYYNLRFLKMKNGFKLVSGLLTRKEKSAQKDKIQIIAWNDNPIQRLFGIFQLNLYQASSAEVIGGKAIAVPGCFQSHIDSTIESVIPGARSAEYEVHGIHPLARFRFILFGGLLPCLAISVLLWLLQGTVTWWVWLYLPLAVWMGILYHKKRTLRLHQDYIISSSGIFGNSYKIMEIYKIQAVSLNQSFYQWRKDLATVTMYTASGEISIPFIPMEKANELRDYILYRIESDRRSWM